MTIQELITEAKREILSRGLASPRTRLNGLEHLKSYLNNYNNAIEQFSESKEIFKRRFQGYKGKNINGAENSCVNLLFEIYQRHEDGFSHVHTEEETVSTSCIEDNSAKNAREVVNKKSSGIDKLKVSFPPVIDQNSKILILGTMPGEASLRAKEYYADSRNPFWKIIQKVFHGDAPFLSYQEKLKCLHDNHIALWDVYHDCLRDGSLDSNIRDGNNNDIKKLLETYPSIKRIVLNGGKAASAFKVSTNVQVKKATSLSAYITFEEKLRLWGDMLRL